MTPAYCKVSKDQALNEENELIKAHSIIDRINKEVLTVAFKDCELKKQLLEIEDKKNRILNHPMNFSVKKEL